MLGMSNHIRRTGACLWGGRWGLVLMLALWAPGLLSAPLPGVTLRYAGMEDDRVGEGSHAGPNGREDARFLLVLDMGRQRGTVKDIVLQSVDPQGRPSGGQVWDTRPGGAWILGVYRGGHRLNSTDADITHPVQGRVEYDLYANPGDFQQGQRFKATVKFADGTEAAGIAAVDVPAALLRARYAGMLEDRVGQGSHGAANGVQDARFSLQLDTRGARRVVKSIVLHASDEGGNPQGGQVWDTLPGGPWILGVYRQGERLNPTDHEVTHLVEGRADYDIHAEPGSFMPGTHFRAVIRFAEGDEARAVAKVDAPPASLKVTYLGMTEDVVGEASHAGFNGQADGRFDVVLDSGGRQRFVTGIELESTNAQGSPAFGERWDTHPGDFWMLAVYREGTRLNPRDQEIGHVTGDGATYRVFANRRDGFKPGAHYRLTFKFAEGDAAHAQVVIPEATVSRPSPPTPSGTPAAGATVSPPPLKHSRALVPSPWKPATVPFDPACRTGCREVTHVRDSHGADVILRYNPEVDDAVAQWGDCVQSLLACLLDEAREPRACVGEARCPDVCVQLFLQRTAGLTERRSLMPVFEGMFIDRNGECFPADGRK